jgi:hypothetical protein
MDSNFGYWMRPSLCRCGRRRPRRGEYLPIRQDANGLVDMIPRSSFPIVNARSSPCGAYIASISESSNVVQIFVASTFTLASSIWHSCPVHSLAWHSSSALITEGVDGEVRIWMTMIDEPDTFVLGATLDGRGRRKVRSLWFRLPEKEDDLFLELFKDGDVGITSVAASVHFCLFMNGRSARSQL